MVGVSVYIRRNMAESPLFARAKAEGKTSINPLKESFGNKANLKLVLRALFGVTMGLGVMSWSTVFYVQSFFLNIFFGWLSDKTGRKPLILLSLLLAVVSLRPVYEQIYQTTNLNDKTEDKARTTTDKKEALPAGTLLTMTTRHFYTDGTSFQEVEKVTIAGGQTAKTELLKTVFIGKTDEWKLILMVFLLVGISAMNFGPRAAFLVEMFPLKIRYTSLSVPYHVGFGVFGGMALVIATYLVGKATEAHSEQFYLAGLTYPLIIMSVAFVIGLLYLKENRAEQIPKTQSNFLRQARRKLGIVWILLGVAAAYFGIFELGIPKIMSGKQDDLIFGIIVMLVITPVTTVGLFIFGKYALQGEYDE